MLTAYIKTSLFQTRRLQNTAVKPATTSTACNNKVGWYENHERQVKLINKLQPSTLVIGNFTATELSHYKNIYFKFSKQ